MGLQYSAVQWNRQKRVYDFVLAGAVGAFLVLFAVCSKVLFPRVKRGRVFVHPKPNPPGIRAEPALVAAAGSADSEPGVSPGGKIDGVLQAELTRNSPHSPGGKMPPSTAGGTPAARKK